MGLRINTNVVSLAAQRNMVSTSKSLGRALERLASGSRINRAGDDAAGLAISEGLGAQVRGVRVAIRNANDAIGFLNTAEGALSELTNIAQRLRELSIQAANGTYGDIDRGYLNNEVVSLLAEFDRIANQTDFNGVKLLNGTFQETDLQVGINKGETIQFTIGDARASALGAVATASGDQHRMGYSASASSLTINGSSIVLSDWSDYDDVSVASGSLSAMAMAGVVNAKFSEHSVKAYALTNIVTIDNVNMTNMVGTALSGADFTINNVAVSTTGLTSASSINDLIKRINDKANTTGVRARLAEDYSDRIELYATDGRNVRVQYTGGSADGGSDGFWAVINDAANFGGEYATLFSNTGSYSVAISTADNLHTSAVKLVSAESISLGGDYIAALGITNSSISVDEDSAINSINVSTQSGAQDALEIVDFTLRALNGLRADLGAVQNRLESTVSNLSITLENISSARSSIRDTDIAAETAELTRAQILQQAGVAVLGQANATPQVALALLQF